MSKSISYEKASDLAREAFKPYTSTVERNAAGDGFSFRVSDRQGQELLAVPTLGAEVYGDPVRLGEALQRARLDLGKKGHELEPWTMPVLTDATGIPETPPNY
ncbi:hypothetical protein [Pseudomonas mangiferae]|uniref:DUF3509 domain-containing protein n=1 Tax=Pseudomonas mangiferae TaxID=2593654 RepID=A0A553GUQ2_9PSED|nr:hypothetical protein [Pseudomonas mangiferae]TRX73221.1 hypothetical protein FM069_18780 [Pseudomonas mangiferae]